MAGLERRLRELHRVKECPVVPVPENELLAAPVPDLFGGLQALEQWSEDAHEPRLVDEGQQDHGLPSEALAVEIQAKVCGIEVDQRGEGLLHQLTHGHRDASLFSADRRQDAHQLLERLEGLTLLEVAKVATLERGTANQVGGKRSVVVRVEPCPRLATLVVVHQYPAEAFDISLADALEEVHQVILFNLELLKVIALLPVRTLAKPDGVGHGFTQVLAVVEPVAQGLVELLGDPLARLLLVQLWGLALLRFLLGHPALRCCSLQVVQVHGETLRQQLRMPRLCVRGLRGRSGRPGLPRGRAGKVAAHLHRRLSSLGHCGQALRLLAGTHLLQFRAAFGLALQPVLEDLIFNAAQVLEELLHLWEVHLATIGQVLFHRWQDLRVQGQHLVNAAIPNGEGRQVR
mmetsp:Transcript_73111/g.201769  ORF Transcript_73111/g.201769 Transcript_73111/m.201769 type:complete len:403 (+) Transcript_73111:921-2129(+)